MKYLLRSSLISDLILVFAVLAYLMIDQRLISFDTAVYVSVSAYVSSSATAFMKAFSIIGSSKAVALIAVIVCCLPFVRKFDKFSLAGGVALVGGLNTLLKHLFMRPRPELERLAEATGYSFPSGHSMGSAALYTLAALIIFRNTSNLKIRIITVILCLFIPITIGISRIYLGVHYASDVLAGWTLGVAVALIADTIVKYIEERKHPSL